MENPIQKTEPQPETKASPREMLTAERALLANRLRVLEDMSQNWEETNAFFQIIEEVSTQIREVDAKIITAEQNSHKDL